MFAGAQGKKQIAAHGRASSARASLAADKTTASPFAAEAIERIAAIYPTEAVSTPSNGARLDRPRRGRR